LRKSSYNLATNSEAFDSGAYIQQNVTVNANAITAPDGTDSADYIQENTSNGRHRVYDQFSVSSGTTYTASVYVKSSTRNLLINANTAFNAMSSFSLTGNGSVLHTHSGSATITNVGNGWYRCTVTGTATSSTTHYVFYQAQDGATDSDYTGDGSSGIYLWGAQIEQSAYATSHIPTYGATATRAADVSSSSSSTIGNSFYKESEGTVFAISQTPVPSHNYQSIVNIGSSTKPFSLSLQRNLDWSRGFGASTTSANTASTGSGSGSYPVNTFVSQAFAGKEDDFALCTDGGSIAADTDTDVIPLPEYMYIGVETSSNKISTFHIKRITYWPQRLPDATLQTITS
jgi:hypothetical protein